MDHGIDERTSGGQQGPPRTAKRLYHGNHIKLAVFGSSLSGNGSPQLSQCLHRASQPRYPIATHSTKGDLMEIERSYNPQEDSQNTFDNTVTYIERLPNRRPFKPLSGLVKIITQLFYN